MRLLPLSGLRCLRIDRPSGAAGADIQQGPGRSRRAGLAADTPLLALVALLVAVVTACSSGVGSVSAELQTMGHRNVDELGGSSSMWAATEEVVIAVLTSEAVMEERIPRLVDAWVRHSPFPVLFVAEQRVEDVDVFLLEYAPQARVHVVDRCAASKEGIPCKTAAAFESLWALYPAAKWFVRVMDDTLVNPATLAMQLATHEEHNLWLADQPAEAAKARAGTLVGEIVDTNVPGLRFPTGGAGWAMDRAAVAAFVSDTARYHRIHAESGRSSAFPHLHTGVAHSDDVYFGVWAYEAGVALVHDDAWSQRPADPIGGLVLCSEEEMPDIRPRILDGVTGCRMVHIGNMYFPNGTTRQVVAALDCQRTRDRFAAVHMGYPHSSFAFTGPDPWLTSMTALGEILLVAQSAVRGTLMSPLLGYYRLCIRPQAVHSSAMWSFLRHWYVGEQLYPSATEKLPPYLREVVRNVNTRRAHILDVPVQDGSILHVSASGQEDRLPQNCDAPQNAEIHECKVYRELADDVRDSMRSRLRQKHQQQQLSWVAS